MASNVEDLTVTYEQDGIELVKELDKAVLSKGAWSTIVFRYRNWSKGKEKYSDDKYTIRRYRKIDGEYRQQSKFNISSVKQARKLIDILSGWID